MRSSSWIALSALALVPARPALACGGFFCSAAPIDQAGESIAYAFDDGTLTMAVQIQYRGDDDDFAWILPVPAPPEISLGTDALFTTLRAATEPVFVTRRVTEGVCRDHPQCVYADGSSAYGGGCGGGGGGGPSPWMGGYVDAAADEPAPPSAWSDAGIGEEVTVISQGPVGPYETVVLGSSSAAEVVSWLRANDYDVPEGAVPRLEAYEGARQIFVALRLASNPDTRQIRPVVLRMATTEACLPIRLTAIATVPDMPIHAYFLGDAPVASTNYSFFEMDTDDLALWQGTRSWTEAADEGVDAMGGQAFTTLYAGPTPAVSIELPAVDDLAGETDPARFLRALTTRGYSGSSVLLDLLRRYMPAPEGQALYNCLTTSSTAACGSPTSFDPAGLAAAIEAEITVPRREAHALVHSHGHLTRLYTSMSAADMTIDPVFAQNADLPAVSNVHEARFVTACSDAYYDEDAPRHWEIDGRTYAERPGSPADDRAYCESLGAYLPGEAPAPRDSSGCLCGVAGGGAVQWGALGAALLLILARRRRHS